MCLAVLNEAGPGGRPARFSRKRRVAGQVHSHGPCAVAPPTPLPTSRPVAPPPPPAAVSSLTAIRPCRFPLGVTNWSRQEIEGSPAARLWSCSLGRPDRCTGPQSWLSGPAGFPAERQDRRCEEDCAYCPQSIAPQADCQRSPEAGGGAGCWSGPALQAAGAMRFCMLGWAWRDIRVVPPSTPCSP